MNIEKKIGLITRNAKEILNEKDMKKVLKKKNLIVYCGYEPSGEIHIGHLVTMMKVLDFQRAGINPIILLADWHAWLNKKGDWDSLEKQVKIWEKGIKAVGLTKARFIKGTDFQRKTDYIDDIMTMALNTTVNRGLRSMQAIARDINNAKISQIIYPLMQIEDIKVLNLDFVVAGLEQRKIHVLGIELFQKINMKKKPIFIHTGLITSLRGPGDKMSSSSPEGMISIRDSKLEIAKKIKKAHCITGKTNENPILEITRYLLFPKFEKLVISRSKEHGGNKTYMNYETLEKDFASKKLHPLDLKNAVAESLEKLLAPIRKAWK
ncbi:MAG: tyrosine--tRNA ligase [Nanoarchaeota archaeon]|nr:tyrosine--tRNA ligase [Nanoarchaeota archaeon]